MSRIHTLALLSLPCSSPPAATRTSTTPGMAAATAAAM
jgi:hypothetical protein